MGNKKSDTSKYMNPFSEKVEEFSVRFDSATINTDIFLFLTFFYIHCCKSLEIS